MIHNKMQYRMEVQVSYHIMTYQANQQLYYQ